MSFTASSLAPSFRRAGEQTSPAPYGQASGAAESRANPQVTRGPARLSWAPTPADSSRASGTTRQGQQMRLALTAALAAALSALSLPAQADITIGVINSLSGNFATFGARYRTGMEVALDEINASGGIKGQKITLSVQDDRSEAQSALAAGEELASPKDVPLVMGSYASSITGPLAQF